jgi:4a-hydroxytetrahydrobiopterin dehydratase
MAEQPLADKTCVPCDKGAPPLKGDALRTLAKKVPRWEVVDEHHLLRTFKFKDFQQALDWVNKVGELAESIGHHPWFHFTWGTVRLELFTHKADGLVENDFILAARIDRLWDEKHGEYGE